MNPDIDLLQPYPFQRMATLKAGITPATEAEHIPLSIGEPKHPAPGFITESVITHQHGLSIYPTTRGIPALRQAIVGWLNRRFNIGEGLLDAEKHVLPVNGTREALFAFTQALVKRTPSAKVLMPNPFYQIYEGAALLAGAEPVFLNTTAETDFIPDYQAVDDATWDACQLLFLCSPGNPTGAVTNAETLGYLMDKAEKHDFVIASDECYSELYFDEAQPPVGLLEVAAARGNTEFKRCMVFHSLSKRSNLPGLRSGFVAGDNDLIEPFFQYRTYHGCAMPVQHQSASIEAWNDEKHVQENRRLYKEKFEAVLDILSPHMNVGLPDASFYLWPETPIDDEIFTRDLFAQENVTVVPGSYLSRDTEQGNPGKNRVRMALVAPMDECVDAAKRMARFVHSLK